MADLFELYNGTGGSEYYQLSGIHKGQTFTPSEAHTLTEVRVRLKVNTGTATYNISIYATNVSHLPTGGALAVMGTFTNADIAGGYAVYTFNDDSCELEADTEYAIAIERTSGSGTFYMDGHKTPGYADGYGLRWYGGVWEVIAFGTDRYFAEYGDASVLPPGKATNPTPANEATKVGEAQMFVDTVALIWDAPGEMGSGAEYLQYKIYFRKYGDGWSLLGTINHSANNGWSVGSLEAFTLYQWRIDSYDTDADVTTTGDAWWFVTAHESFYVSFFNDPTRRDDYDPDEIWDENNEAWYDQDEIGIQLAIAGGGRYKQQIIAIGTNNSGVGKIYFGDV